MRFLEVAEKLGGAIWDLWILVWRVALETWQLIIAFILFILLMWSLT